MKRTLSLLGLLLGIPLALAQSSGVNGIGGVSISGTVVAGHCTQFTAGGQIADAGGACGTSSMVYPGAGVANSTGTAWGTSYSSSNPLPNNILAPGGVNIQSGTTYTLALTDMSGLVIMTNNTANGAVTIPPNSSVPFPVGARIEVEQATTAANFVTAIASGVGVTIHCSLNCTGLGPGNLYTLIQSAANTWEVIQDSFPQTSTVFGNGICAGCVGPSGNVSWTNNKGGVGTGIIWEDGGMWLLDTAGGFHPAWNIGWNLTYSSASGSSNFNEWKDAIVEQRSADEEAWLTETANHTIVPGTDAATGYFLDATSASVTITLPAANFATPALLLSGIREEICRKDSSANTATIVPAGTDHINGSGSITLTSKQCVILQSDSTSNWYEVGNTAGGGGGGTVTTTGSPASGQIAQFSGSSSITTATAANVLSLINSQTCNAQTGTTYTFVIGDANNCITMTNAAANTVTVPANASVAFPIGTTETVLQTGAGATTLQGAGTPVTLQSAKFGSSTTQTYAFSAEYSCLSIQKIATDTWFVSSCDYNPGSGSGVTSFTGDGTLISNSGSTGAVTATVASAAANSLWGNTSGSSGAPGYHAFNSTELAILADTTAIVASVCTPSASSLAPTTGGTITQPATPCTTVTFTFAVAAPHGWNCTMGDVTQANAGTFLPNWTYASNSTTTCVVKIPVEAQVASDVLSLQSSWY